MDDSVRDGRLRALPHLFPFTFAIVTVTALVAANPGEGIRPANLILPLELAVLAALIGSLLGHLFCLERGSRSAVGLVFVLITLIPGYLFGWAAGLGRWEAAEELQLVLALLTFAGAVLVIRRIVIKSGAVRFLNVMSVALLAFTLPAVARLRDGGNIRLPPPSSTVPEAVVERPDIYLVTLDAYTGEGSLASVYGFDNMAILDSLRRREFRIPVAQAANYPNTFLSVGSMLRRRYADDLAEAAAPDHRDRRAAYRALELNQTVVDLNSLGYRFYYVGSSYPPMAANRLAEGAGALTISRDFESLWLSTTILQPARSVGRRLIYRDGRPIPFAAEGAAATDASIDQFLSYAARPGPKFVYLHLMLPHGPFRYGPSCEHRPGVWTVGREAVTDSTAERLFLEQLQCTNLKILQIVDAIRDVSGESAVILLQADHGFGRFVGDNPSRLKETSRDQILERFDIFAAYAGPGVVVDSLATVRSPVNLFRTLFRVLWGVDEPALPDRHFWSNPDRPMRLIEVDLDSIASFDRTGEPE